MASFGADVTVHDNHMTAFKIQGQIYHLLDFMFPSPNAR